MKPVCITGTPAIECMWGGLSRGFPRPGGHVISILCRYPFTTPWAGRLLVAGRYEEALHQVQTTLELNPNFSSAHQTLGWIYLNEGERDQAIYEFKSAVDFAGDSDNDFIVDLGFAYATAGHRMEARKILNQLKKKCEQGLATSASVAILYGALGKSDQAFAWLLWEKLTKSATLSLPILSKCRRADSNH
jgi:tetratricopeptide (TPR) repeat protein